MGTELQFENQDALAQMLIDEKIRGKSYQEIAAKHGLPVDEVIGILRDVYQSTTIRDPLEYRALLQLRVEKIIDHLWDGLEQGSFKHGEAVLKAVNTLQELHALNEQIITTQVRLITDEETRLLFAAMSFMNKQLEKRMHTLPLNKAAKLQLEAWPEWSAEAATDAVEQVIYAAELSEENNA